MFSVNKVYKCWPAIYWTLLNDDIFEMKECLKEQIKYPHFMKTIHCLKLTIQTVSWSIWQVCSTGLKDAEMNAETLVWTVIIHVTSFLTFTGAMYRNRQQRSWKKPHLTQTCHRFIKFILYFQQYEYLSFYILLLCSVTKYGETILAIYLFYSCEVINFL